MSEPTSTSEWLATVWRELLDVTSVSPDSDFYDLGGHSVFALQLLSLIADRYSVVVGVEDLFTFRTLGALSQRIDSLRKTCPTQRGADLTQSSTVGSTTSGDTAPAKLTGWWKFEEGSGGTAADVSGNGSLLAAHGDPAWTRGSKFGGAVELDGETQWFSARGPVVRTDQSYSVAAWVRLDSVRLDGKVHIAPDEYATTVLSQDGPEYSQFYLGVRLIKELGPDGTVKAWWPRWTFTVSPPPPLGGPFDWLHACGARPVDPAVFDQWVLVVGVYDLSRRVVQVHIPSTGDQGAIPLPDGWPTWYSDGAFQVGQARFLDKVADQWRGSVGAVRTYAGVLTEQEIADLWTAGR